MEALLIDIGALTVFLSAVAIAYWRGISHETQAVTRRGVGISRATGASNCTNLPRAQASAKLPA
jgi:hypothetical protein